MKRRQKLPRLRHRKLCRGTHWIEEKLHSQRDPSSFHLVLLGREAPPSFSFPLACPPRQVEALFEMLAAPLEDSAPPSLPPESGPSGWWRPSFLHGVPCIAGFRLR